MLSHTPNETVLSPDIPLDTVHPRRHPVFRGRSTGRRSFHLLPCHETSEPVGVPLSFRYPEAEFALSMVLSLHLSAFLAFIAAIFDLSQNLVRGRVATNLGQDLNSVMGLIIVREIGFSFSVGLRFFFFWFFVAQPPSGEQDIPGDMHSGSWGRWGGLGMVLKWGMAMVCVVIPILQILDRIVTPLHKFSGVYEVEGTMEIVASAVFILKLGLNTYLAVLSTPKGEPKWKSLQGYVAVILALVLSAAIGVGNVALCTLRF